MRITLRRLKNLIKEEVKKVIKEDFEDNHLAIADALTQIIKEFKAGELEIRGINIPNNKDTNIPFISFLGKLREINGKVEESTTLKDIEEVLYDNQVQDIGIQKGLITFYKVYEDEY